MGRTRSRDTEHPQARLDHGGIAGVMPSEFTTGFELIVDGTPQSHVDLDDPTHLHFEYIVRMGAVIDQLAAGPLTAVHLGAGAMTIPRYIEATRPGSRQQVIELEAPLAQLVREHLPLPKGASIRIRIGDARAGVTKLPNALRTNCDLVVSDVYSGAQTPAHLTSVEFYRELAELLAPGGVLLVNVADGPGLAFARRQTATIAEVLPEVAVLADTQVLKGRRFGNLVIAASAAPLPTEWLPRILAAGPHPAKIAQGAEVETFTQGARIVTDADAVASPRPDASLFLR
ncbi:fused MFS/spermidine synthase [Microbacterium sp. KSW4-16]|uniref:Fused MFS/spermidine synthase n=1 Tax=Microbacterium aurugineum TaxID=2851642 RepID=A0ABY4J0S5_9MICO|nr:MULTISPECIES: fused MFS/spermidine synthase [Microbacterium]MCK8466976.1 fused MFS/spermidine synthase [Microbacterium aurugineum]QEA28640.1 spermine synthase [Microbacterium sp. CBA3102]TCJ28180.1 spermine synthase [Microbacterium sp. PI-1]UPL18615.1 fused MFS/spermidine synthase [Microbacterium aurugineum]